MTLEVPRLQDRKEDLLRPPCPHVRRFTGSLVGTVGHDVVLLGPANGEIAWRSALPELETRSSNLNGARLVGATLVTSIVAMQSPGGVTQPSALVAFDAATGAVRWRTPLAGAPHGGIATDGARVYVVVSDDVITAVDVGTGRVAWTRPRQHEHGHGALAADAGFLAVGVGLNHLEILDACGGREIARAPVKTRDVEVRGTTVYVSGTVSSAEADGADIDVVAALDATNGREIWRRPVSVDQHSELFLDDDVVYVRDAGGVLRALDRATGAERWSYGLGGTMVGDDPLRVRYVRPVADEPMVIVATEAVGGRRALLAFRRGAGPTPAEHATFSGRVTLDGRGRAGVLCTSATRPPRPTPPGPTR